MTREEVGANGLLVRAFDAIGKMTEHVYGAFNARMKIIDPNGNKLVTLHDAYGRVQHAFDPDMGHWTHTYNAFGELESESDAKSPPTVTHFDYDRLGRNTKKVADGELTTWTWDAAIGAGKGRLASAVTPDGYVDAFTYDALGRVFAEQRTMPASGPPNASELAGQALSFVREYDAQGRLSVVHYPTLPGDQPVAVRYGYDAAGNLAQASDALAGTSTARVYWQAVSADAEGRVTEELLGNGATTMRSFYARSGRLESLVTSDGTRVLQNETYSYNGDGALRNAVDHLATGDNTAQSEYIYDVLKRLGRVTRTSASGSVSSVSMWYDQVGNILRKSDVGTYSYDPAHPHAVASLATGVDIEHYEYDAVGNLVSRNGVPLTYTSFNKPKTVGDSHLYEYDAWGNRAAKRVAGVGTTVYAGRGLYERFESEQPGASGSERRYYVVANGVPVAVLVQTGADAAASQDVYYLHRDRLGSVVLVTDAGGAVAAGRTYDAFGQVTSSASSYLASINVGFTGHEDELELGLIDMGGRIYDPRLGVFTTADPFIPMPFSSQGLNPYSYVLNNPLMFTDPTGYFNWKPWAAGGIILVTFVANIATEGALTPVLIGEIVGFTAAYAQGGDVFMGTLVGGMVGGIAGGIGSIGLSGGWVAQIGQSAAQGAAQGALYGFLVGYGGGAGDSDDVKRNVLRGAMIGGIVGAAKPLVTGLDVTDTERVQELLHETALPNDAIDQIRVHQGGLFGVVEETFGKAGATYGSSIHMSSEGFTDFQFWHEVGHVLQFQEEGYAAMGVAAFGDRTALERAATCFGDSTAYYAAGVRYLGCAL